MVLLAIYSNVFEPFIHFLMFFSNCRYFYTLLIKCVYLKENNELN